MLLCKLLFRHLRIRSNLPAATQFPEYAACYIACQDHVTMLHLSKSRMPMVYVSVLSEHGVPAGAGLLGAQYVC